MGPFLFFNVPLVGADHSVSETSLRPLSLLSEDPAELVSDLGSLAMEALLLFGLGDL